MNPHLRTGGGSRKHAYFKILPGFDKTYCQKLPQCLKALITFSMNLLAVFKGHANLELFFVMMVYPFVLNCAQYWVQDHFLKGTEFIEEQ